MTIRVGKLSFHLLLLNPWLAPLPGACSPARVIVLMEALKEKHENRAALWQGSIRTPFLRPEEARGKKRIVESVGVRVSTNGGVLYEHQTRDS
jgi:hypothetical protein